MKSGMVRQRLGQKKLSLYRYLVWEILWETNVPAPDSKFSRTRKSDKEGHPLSEKASQTAYAEALRAALATAPYEHQWETVVQTWEKRAWAFFLEMGTGKSKILIDTAVLLSLHRGLDAVLIVAPKGTYANWVNQEIPKHWGDRLVTMRLWNPATTKQNTESLKRFLFSPGHPRILVMNTEALSTKKGVGYAEKFLKSAQKPLMAVDESTAIKNPSARRTKAAIKLGRLAHWTRIMTGSPVTKSPLDLYSQCEFLGAKMLGSSSFYTFRNRYAVMVRRNMGGRTFNEITGYRNVDKLNTRLDQFSTRILKDECLDLPEKVYTRREVELTIEQRRHYDALKTFALTVLEGDTLTAPAIITQLLRLHQVVCGHLPIPDTDRVEDIPNHRVSTLLDVVEETSGKVIIWANYRHDIKAVSAALAKAHGPRSVATYYGDTSVDDRQIAVERFQDPDDELRFFVGQGRTGGYGLTLTAANTVVYYSNSYDLEVRLQSEDRAHRIGQQKSVTYVDLISPGTVDQKIVEALRSKIDIATEVHGDTVREWLVESRV